MKVRAASFALRVVRRHTGDAAIVYRRSLDEKQQERLTRMAAIGPLAFTAATPLLRAAVRSVNGNGTRLAPGPFLPLDRDWGARVACFALLASGLRNTDRLSRVAERLRHADGAEAAWWLGLLTRSNGEPAVRALRALRILTEAVE